MQVVADMQEVVVRFLRKHFEQRLMDRQRDRIASEIVDYMQQVLVTYCEMRKEELLPCIVEDVLRCLPRDAAAGLPKSSVVSLFNRMVRLYNARNEVARKDIIWGIVENACEVMTCRDRDGGHMQQDCRRLEEEEFHVEIWRQFFVTLPMEQVKGDMGGFIEEVRSCMDRIKGDLIQLGTHGDYIQSILPAVKSYVLEHGTEEISIDDIERVLAAYYD